MFWEHQNKDLSFNYVEYSFKKEVRVKKHFEKMVHLEMKRTEA